MMVVSIDQESLTLKSRVEERQPLSWESQENMEQW